MLPPSQSATTKKALDRRFCSVIAIAGQFRIRIRDAALRPRFSWASASVHHTGIAECHALLSHRVQTQRGGVALGESHGQSVPPRPDASQGRAHLALIGSARLRPCRVEEDRGLLLGGDDFSRLDFGEQVEES